MSGLLVGLVAGIDLEEMVEDDHHHGAGAEEEGEAVEVVIGDHFEGLIWVV